MFNEHDPLGDEWQPIDKDIIVSLRSVEVFGDGKARYGRVSGWHLISELGDDPFTPDPQLCLEYQVNMLKSKSAYWVPAEAIVGFIQGVKNSPT